MREEQPYVSALGVLRYLDEAGPEGMMAGVLARKFAYRETYFSSRTNSPSQRRLAELNTVFDSLQRNGRVRRGRRMEQTPVYHNVPSWRWYITAAGHAYLAAGGRDGIAAARAATREQAHRERAEARTTLAEETVLRVARLPEQDLVARNQLICEVYGKGLLTLGETGAFFGLTRERVRQITTPGYRRTA